MIQAKDYIDFFKEVLEIDSTSGKEAYLAKFLYEKIGNEADRAELLEVGDGTYNLRLSWGKPRLYFCTHLDTVPPYISPKFTDDIVYGRGSCDAKGQIFSMYLSCLNLRQKGVTDFGLLLLAGEETGSFGAKAYTRDCNGTDCVIVGEPTENKNIIASKGTKLFDIQMIGKSCHSGYPHLGHSAVELFIDFMNDLRNKEFPIDNQTGKTTYNVGKLISDNPQNILSDSLKFRLYFRTTKASDNEVVEYIMSKQSDIIKIENLGGDTPLSYYTFENIPKDVVSFGSDAPRLTKFKDRCLCGPGSIFVAHTDKEHIKIEDINKAIEQYVYMAESYLNR